MRAFRLPRLRRRCWLAIAGAIFLQWAITLGAWAWLPTGPPVPIAWLGVALGLPTALLLIIGVVIDRRLAKPLVATIRGAEIMAGTNPGHRLELSGSHWLERLPDTLSTLAASIARSRRDLEAAAAAWTTKVEARKTRLETILREIREGVMVCDTEGHIRLYNRTTRDLLSTEPALGLGRRVGEVLNEGPLRHTLDLLTSEGAASDAELVCATASGERLLRCRVARLITEDPDTSGFVMTLQDVSRETRESLRREQALRAAVESLRNPLTSLGAATESLRLAHQHGLQQEVGQFTDIISEERDKLTERFAHLSRETSSALTANWRLEDVHLGSLVNGIRQAGGPESLPRLQCRADVWLSAEPYLLYQVIEALLMRLRRDLGVTAVALSGREEGSLVYVDMNWSGDVVSADHLDEWLDAGLDDVGGTVTLREVLQRHDTTAWSQPDLSRTGRALLRLPLPGAPEKMESQAVVPPRPEVYDFAMDEDTRPLGTAKETPLRDLDFVVFDCETTGLEPSQGDEIVSIGAVRIHRGQVMHGETFELLANPGRSIPALASSIHGIHEEDVAEAPPVEEVIRRFHAFAGDAVLVGFNIAFDMRFLRLKQRICGITFANPTLDALLLSIMLHDHTGEHTMESVAARLDVGVGGRHTALGDSLTTAEIFIRLLALLPGESIHTLGDAVAAQERMIEFRRQQRAF
ncbi:PAS domain-containing protein [Spiribacter sp. 2438]|uniref:3'-5' exonuclease n=1 Tax=Spiribacter sp. 2438 TaxID=2666185 RepID=UPI0012B0D316|nr:exonuclease domain-containing protein [Spiribacter sp. 2438]QGM21366.1 PAS domain-containing protein [Spiribacter sp. 2438]